ncbi:phenolic glucoside malonyltransferase 2-like [Pyrus communis]|uniref:phenolic glucoside malonyltransferase 2-like n=1 Tax=Pyrus communis TaxID=23211 RepID=UPI0035C20A4A
MSMMSMMAKEKQQAGHSVQLHLSTFSLTCAYTWVCLVKAKEIKEKKVLLVFNVDCRSRLDPPLPATYFGNCIAPHGVIAETGDLMGEDGLFVALTAVSTLIKRLYTDSVLNGMETWIPVMFDAQTSTDGIFSVAGSHRFELYDAADFGWGRPMTIELVSIDRTGAISLSDSKNGGGGVEIGLALKKHSREAFASLFAKGLEQL